MESSIRRQRPSARRRFRLLAAVLAATVLASGLLLWWTVRSDKRVYTSMPVMPGRMALTMEYPADWFVDARNPPLVGSPSNSSIAWAELKRRPVTGLQRLLEEVQFGPSGRDWSGAEVSVLLEAVSDRHLDLHEMALYYAGLSRQVVRRGGSFSIHESRCAAGPLLDIQISYVNAPQRFQGMLALYPPAQNGRPQYEVLVSRRGPLGTEKRLRQLALDVVSSVRLVKQSEGSAASTVAATASEKEIR